MKKFSVILLFLLICEGYGSLPDKHGHVPNSLQRQISDPTPLNISRLTRNLLVSSTASYFDVSLSIKDPLGFTPSTPSPKKLGNLSESGSKKGKEISSRAMSDLDLYVRTLVELGSVTDTLAPRITALFFSALDSYRYISRHMLLGKNSTNYVANITCFDFSESRMRVCIPEAVPYSFDTLDQLYNYLRKSLYNSSGNYSILDICRATVFDIYGQDLPPKLWEFYLIMHYLIYDEIFVQTCLPLYRNLSQCKTQRNLVKCLDGIEVVVFLNDHQCHQPSSYDSYFNRLLAASALEEKHECFQRVCDGTYRILEIRVSNITVILHPWKGSCDKYATDLIRFYIPKMNHSLHLTLNTQWPCCYPNYMVWWTQNPEQAGFIRDWDYLPYKCRIGEMVLLTFMILVAVFGVLGNLLVVVVMFNGGHRNQASCFLRTSLSIADLITSLLVAVPAVYYTFARMNGSMESKAFYHLDIVNSRVNRSYERPVDGVYYEYFTFSDNCFFGIQAVALCLALTVSMMMMLYLSVERAILPSYPFTYKKIFTLPRIKIAIFLGWVVGIASVILCSFDKTYFTYWNTWTKFPILLSNLAKNNKLFEGVSIFLFIIGIATIVFSGISLVFFLRTKAKLAAERESWGKVIGDFEKQDIYITITLIIIATPYVFTVIPVGITTLIEYKFFYIKNRIPLLVFLSWWAMLAGSAINPFIYNMRSHLYRSDMAECLQRILPKPLKRKIDSFVTHSPKRIDNYLKKLDEEAAKTGENANHHGLPKGSQLGALGFGFEDSPC